jgi:hypothetical protein
MREGYDLAMERCVHRLYDKLLEWFWHHHVRGL